MNAAENPSLKPSEEQVQYANLLLIGVLVGILVLFVTYAIYLTGILTPHVDTNLVTGNWGKGVNEYLELTHSPQGWGWVPLLEKGDFLNYIGFALLALLTVFCYLVLVKGYYHQKDWIYFVISVLEIIVLALAASGILGAGGH